MTINKPPVVLGVSVVEASPTAFNIVKFVGAGYLGWLAFTLLRSAFRTWRARRRSARRRRR